MKKLKKFKKRGPFLRKLKNEKVELRLISFFVGNHRENDQFLGGPF